MLDERPTATELVAAVRGFLEKKVAGALEGQTAFHLKVAINTLQIIERELQQAPAVIEAERTRLARLLTLPGDRPLAELNRELARRLREERIDDNDPLLRDHLWQSVLARMAIDSPRYPQLAQVPAHRHTRQSSDIKGANSGNSAS